MSVYRVYNVYNSLYKQSAHRYCLFHTVPKLEVLFHIADLKQFKLGHA